ncbi:MULTISPECIES: glycoside hydrolase family 15 protein [Arthrobacter]|uniref:glucan 1,4-alpha-glucosidase n=1 Tax=Arthrobacter terricola TaxID=2547396 RepID=A0A4R5KEV8_9MICC|nr:MULTISPECIES: glycoside hydrolase family 15 protein [Arthrobacter]MBT8161763.1 glycoside hydrolase family 15 protein [Arthrobacter sp. GN70]TDF92670.1 glucoamylase [Arthrobacter terricola]
MSEHITSQALPSRTSRAPQLSRARANVENSLAPGAIDLAVLGPTMYTLMFRNIASDGFIFSDPQFPDDISKDSKPGCIIAAPSFPAETPGTDEDYVFNWVRDGAITAMEVAKANMPTRPEATVQTLNDYVAFAGLCHSNAQPPVSKGHACFTIAGDVRPWTEQNDGPALQTITLLAAYNQLAPDTQQRAVDLVNSNVAYLLGVYQDVTTNLWEEHTGYSFFARAAQRRCFQEIQASLIPGIDKLAGLKTAIDWLSEALAGHWDGTQYVSMMADPGNGAPPSPHDPVAPAYDPNIDVVQSAVYGAVPVTDTKLLATAARLRTQWEEGGEAFYPINKTDKERFGIGPLFGRYPGDEYDGDTSDPVLGGHPWALTTCNVAELHYKLAAAITSSANVPLDALSAVFFAQSGIDASTSAADAAVSLTATGDAMMRAVVYHSDNLELSEQFDGTTGYERSVRNLTWSYAAFLSALRARAVVA